MPPTAQLKSDASSPWARQWCAGPVNGAMEAVTEFLHHESSTNAGKMLGKYDEFRGHMIKI